MEPRASASWPGWPRVRRLTLVDTNKDPKTRLQEFLQSRACELPRYEVVDIQGEPHCRTFFVECEVVC
jgi:ribonuclease-3